MRAFFLACPMAILSMGGAMAEGARWSDSRTVWTGPYLGVQGGYAAADVKSGARARQAISDDVVAGMGFASGANPIFSMARDVDGFGGGVYFGYMRQLNSGLVLGAEADLNALSLSERGDHALRARGRVLRDVVVSEGEGVSERASVGGAAEDRIKWSGGLRARAGYAAGRFQPYLTGGLAIAKYRGQGAFAGQLSSESEGETEAALLAVEDASLSSYWTNKKLYGWTLGAGLEFAATENIVARVEYRYSDYGDVGSELYSGGERIGAGAKTSITAHDLRAGLALKF